jgi:hypothetical protein
LKARSGFEKEKFRYKSGTLFEGIGELNENKGAKLEARVGIEPATTLRRQKLLILLNGKNAKNTAITQVRYTAGTPVRTQ